MCFGVIQIIYRRNQQTNKIIMLYNLGRPSSTISPIFLEAMFKKPSFGVPIKADLIFIRERSFLI